jgi:alkaline phosphatase D
MTIEQKSAQVLEWLNMPEEERPDFISVYISAVDTAGHNGGVNSQLVSTRII